ncbi:MAG: sulfatase [Candidatus Erginobacter occultus]|nr:sulfatase [Candidatus Erginobacter occultus]
MRDKVKIKLVLIVLLLPGLFPGCGRSPEKDRPNLLLISVDTLRADHLGCYGYDRPTSENIDRLAEEGVLFENAFSASPWTTPSHMSIMTGYYPRVHNVYMWGRDARGIYSGKVLSGNIPTLAEILKEHGYTNVAFTGGANVAGKIGFARGFEIYDEDSDTDAAVEWLRENADRRFFMFYHTYFTHSPYLPAPPYDSKYDPSYSGEIPSRVELMKEMGMEKNDLWQGLWQALHNRYWSAVAFDDPADWYHLKALYDGSIEAVDAEFIKELIGTLRAKGVLDRTLVVFTSDHGEEFLEHGRAEHDSIYREVAQVPLILRLPGVLPAGTRVRQLVRNIDILPTILELLGIPPEREIQGISLMPAVTRGEALDLEVHADSNDFLPPAIESVRSGPWFLLMDQREIRDGEPDGIKHPGFFRLFNTDEDPGETRDVRARYPEVTDRLRKRLRAQRIESSRKFAEEAADQEDASVGRWNVERLKALGYL